MSIALDLESQADNNALGMFSTSGDRSGSPFRAEDEMSSAMSPSDRINHVEFRASTNVIVTDSDDRISPIPGGEEMRIGFDDEIMTGRSAPTTASPHQQRHKNILSDGSNSLEGIVNPQEMTAEQIELAQREQIALMMQQLDGQLSNIQLTSSVDLNQPSVMISLENSSSMVASSQFGSTTLAAKGAAASRAWRPAFVNRRLKNANPILQHSFPAGFGLAIARQDLNDGPLLLPPPSSSTKTSMQHNNHSNSSATLPPKGKAQTQPLSKSQPLPAQQGFSYTAWMRGLDHARRQGGDEDSSDFYNDEGDNQNNDFLNAMAGPTLADLRRLRAQQTGQGLTLSSSTRNSHGGGNSNESLSSNSLLHGLEGRRLLPSYQPPPHHSSSLSLDGSSTTGHSHSHSQPELPLRVFHAPTLLPSLSNFLLSTSQQQLYKPVIAGSTATYEDYTSWLAMQRSGLKDKLWRYKGNSLDVDYRQRTNEDRGPSKAQLIAMHEVTSPVMSYALSVPKLERVAHAEAILILLQPATALLHSTHRPLQNEAIWLRPQATLEELRAAVVRTIAQALLLSADNNSSNDDEMDKAMNAEQLGYRLRLLQGLDLKAFDPSFGKRCWHSLESEVEWVQLVASAALFTIGADGSGQREHVPIQVMFALQSSAEERILHHLRQQAVRRREQREKYGKQLSLSEVTAAVAVAQGMKPLILPDKKKPSPPLGSSQSEPKKPLLRASSVFYPKPQIQEAAHRLQQAQTQNGKQLPKLDAYAGQLEQRLLLTRW